VQIRQGAGQPAHVAGAHWKDFMAHTHEHSTPERASDLRRLEHSRERHHHSHGADGAETRLSVALGILGCFTVVEALGGYLAHSIALVAEAAHMLADSAALFLAIFAVRVARRPADSRRTFGHRRYQPLAAFVNGQALLLLTLWVVYEAIVRLMHPPQVEGRLMLIIAVIGGVANIAACVALSGARSLNERGARAHVLSDLLGSVAASVAALVIIFSGRTAADPLLSLFVAALVFRSAWSLTRESADVLLEAVPAGFEVARIESELVGHVPGLISIHHVHAWSMTGERPTVTLHANLASGTSHGSALTAIHARLSERLHVEHTTVQIEDEGPCETPDCHPLTKGPAVGDKG
jgi:cobalt-zinc-cadmium efflux system protein